MNKTIYAIGLIALVGFISTNQAFSQSFEPLRHEPNIFEDEIIFCVKDVKNIDYFGQVSCFVESADNILDKQTADKIYNRSYSLDDTFEMGLID